MKAYCDRYLFYGIHRLHNKRSEYFTQEAVSCVYVFNLTNQYILFCISPIIYSSNYCLFRQLKRVCKARRKASKGGCR